MREVEVKARLRDADMVAERLAELGASVSEPLTQEDVIYAKEVGSLETFLGNDTFLRIRAQGDGTIIFNLKQHHGRKRLMDSAPIEHEVKIHSKETMEAILAILGYQEMVRVSKTRRAAHLGEFEICLDDVEGIGSYIEVEKLIPDDDDQDAAREELRVFLWSLGVLPEDEELRRYDTILIEAR